MRKRILFAINSLAGGGAERVFSSLLAHSEPYCRDYDVQCLLLDNDEERYQLPSFVNVIRLDCQHGFGRSLVRVRQTVRKLRPDISLSFLTRANVATAFAMRGLGRPYIVSERTNTYAQLGKGPGGVLARMLVLLTYPQADRIIAVAQGVADVLEQKFRVKPDRVEVINNWVNHQELAHAASEDPAIAVQPDDVVAVGRLARAKNFPLAIRAFADADTKGRLLILGEGPDRAKLRALGDRVGLGERLVMPGFVANPHAIIARARAFLLSSDYEGFPNAMLEAMALGRPVAATNCVSGPSQLLKAGTSPGPGEVLAGEGGLLVATDDAASMSEALRQVTDPARAAKMGEAAAKRASDFSLPAAVSAYWRVIENVLQVRAAGLHTA